MGFCPFFYFFLNAETVSKTKKKVNKVFEQQHNDGGEISKVGFSFNTPQMVFLDVHSRYEMKQVPGDERLPI